MLQECYKSVKRVLQECYKSVTRVLQVCYKSVRRVLPIKSHQNEGVDGDKGSGRDQELTQPGKCRGLWKI